MPVVVAPDHRQCEVLVIGAREELPAELGIRREAHRTEDAVGVHVLDAEVDVVAALADLVEGGRLHAVLLGWATRDRVEADVRDLDALVDPDVGAVVLVDHAGHFVAVLRGHVDVVPHVGRLHNVVVDADEDEVFGSHGAPLELS